MEGKKISDNMLARMPVYLNYIKKLPKETKNISATKLANALGFGEVSVRKDLAKVSDGGRCKLGYLREDLIGDIENFLGVHHKMDAIVIGKGEWIQMLLGYDGFDYLGFHLIAGFDLDCGRMYGSIHKEIYPMNQLKTFCENHKVHVGVLMVPAKEAQDVCDQLISLGIEAIWNFTPEQLEVPEHVVVQSESLLASVTKLRMSMKVREGVF